jgi:hypothetical protein
MMVGVMAMTRVIGRALWTIGSGRVARGRLRGEMKDGIKGGAVLDIMTMIEAIIEIGTRKIVLNIHYPGKQKMMLDARVVAETTTTTLHPIFA